MHRFVINAVLVLCVGSFLDVRLSPILYGRRSVLDHDVTVQIYRFCVSGLVASPVPSVLSKRRFEWLSRSRRVSPLPGVYG
jgi:hypothetical protein